MKRWPILAICLLSLLMSGCQPNVEPEGTKQLRLAIISKDTYQFMFHSYFSGHFPDWDITVLPMDELNLYEMKAPEAIKTFSDFLQREKPDLVILNGIQYPVLANHELLRDLGEWASRKDGMDLNAFVPGVIDLLKGNEEGKLFGLSPSYRTSVFYYNKTMFRSYGIEEPHDRMTWSEVLKLSDRFMQDASLEKGSYGFYESNIKTPFDMVQTISDTEGMNFVNTRTAKMTMTSDEWKKIWSLVADSYRMGSVGTMNRKLKEIDGTTYVTENDQKAMDLFYQGKTAMTVGQDGLLRKLNSKPPSFEWGIYSGPVSIRDPERVGWFGIDYIFAIPTVSAQPELAWKAIQYFHSEEMGKIYASTDEGLFSLKNYPKWRNDPNYEPFYNQRGWLDTNNFMNSAIPKEFYTPFYKLANEQMNATIAGKLSTEQALAALQKEGQALLDELTAKK
ncbi:ABC transporter substrate-binding protein [Cohnella abietis]|uniref:Sugar ABC transporter substrate-binding protein n=1 Tax=Cohnella abietis TaxID=2507935 RepID=A0A3T1D0N3_9BACL|nr:extracellular solute-binding protein [Cohnella abietis]BBI31660.1 hypothetical protein KCTCHS21_10590 [Cohnella abietis]